MMEFGKISLTTLLFWQCSLVFIGCTTTQVSKPKEVAIVSTNSSTDNPLSSISNIQDAVLYADIVKPVLQARCYSCHGAERQKGGLRLDVVDSLFSVGSTGTIIVKGNAEKSILVQRMLLHENDSKHMPPISYPQPSQHEIAVVEWWVNAGADLYKKVKDIPQTEKIQQSLAALGSGEKEEKISSTDLPQKPIEPANPGLVKQISNAGISIVPVATKSNYLSVNILAASKYADSILQVLYPIKENIIWLKLDNAKLSDTSLSILSNYVSLRKLSLVNAEFSIKKFQKLDTLFNLSSINLTGTRVTSQAVSRLRKIKNIRQLYLYKTRVKQSHLYGLKKLFPKAVIEFGNYIVPTLVSDTTLVK